MDRDDSLRNPGLRQAGRDGTERAKRRLKIAAIVRNVSVSPASMAWSLDFLGSFRWYVVINYRQSVLRNAWILTRPRPSSYPWDQGFVSRTIRAAVDNKTTTCFQQIARLIAGKAPSITHACAP